MGEGSEREIWEEISHYPSSTVHEAAGRIGALPFEIKPLSREFRVCGPAFTVLSPPNDNLWLHRAIYAARPGDILVVDVGTGYESGYWGEIMTSAAMERKLGGLVINGCVRDLDQLLELGFPIFARGICMRGTIKDFTSNAQLNTPARVGDIIILPGDLILGDSDGVVSIPRNRVPEVLQQAKAREDKEKQVLTEISAGKSTLDIYGLH